VLVGGNSNEVLLLGPIPLTYRPNVSATTARIRSRGQLDNESGRSGSGDRGHTGIQGGPISGTDSSTTRASYSRSRSLATRPNRTATSTVDTAVTRKGPSLPCGQPASAGQFIGIDCSMTRSLRLVHRHSNGEGRRVPI
jgi:hypothetical protein